MTDHTPEPDSVREAFEALAWHVEWPMPSEPRDQRWVKVCAKELDALDLQAKYPATIVTPLCSLAAAQSRIASLEAERDGAIERANFMLAATRDAQDVASFANDRWAEAQRDRDEALARVADWKHLFDIRPAVNAGLMESYAEWTGKVYACSIHTALAAASTANQEGDHG